MAYCRKCGTQMVDGAAFCPQCGTGTEVVPSATPAQVPDAGPVATPAQAPSQAPAPKKSRKKLAVGVVAALVVVCAAIGGGLWWKADQDAKAQAAAQAEWERTHVSLVTPVPVQAPGFDDAATAIPVKVSGADLDGAEVDEVQYLRPNAMQVTTLPGTYDLTFLAGYFTGSGGVVKAPDVIRHIEVVLDDAEADDGADASASAASSEASSQSGSADSAGADEPSGKDALSQGASSSGSEPADPESGSASSADPAPAASQDDAQPVVFTEVPALEVTDELIAEIAGWAGQDPQDGGKAQTLGQSASTAHAEAVAAEEARIAAEAEAARKQAELQEAYAANPRTVYATPSRASGPVNLTGTIDVQLGLDQGTNKMEEVVLLVLPNEVTVSGTQYGEISSKMVALAASDETTAQYKALAGKTITVNIALYVRATGSIASAQFTNIIGTGMNLVKTFD